MTNDSIIGIGIAVTGWFIIYFGFILKQNERITENTTKINLIWKMVEDKIATLLLRPTHKAMDELLILFKNGGLDEDDALDLLSHIRQAYGVNGDAIKDKSDVIAYALVEARLVDMINDMERKKLKRGFRWSRLLGR